MILKGSLNSISWHSLFLLILPLLAEMPASFASSELPFQPIEENKHNIGSDCCTEIYEFLHFIMDKSLP